MRVKLVSITAFLIAVAVAAVAGMYSFGDSAHAIGVISQKGGKARHAIHLPAGGDRYTLVVTATVLPPYHGDASVSVEGDPPPQASIHASEPIVDLGIRRRPHFRDGVFRGVTPGDHLAVWVRLKPAAGGSLSGHYKVVFKDTNSGNAVLTIPVLLGDDEGGCCDE